jgi:hypothetical protein
MSCFLTKIMEPFGVRKTHLHEDISTMKRPMLPKDEPKKKIKKEMAKDTSANRHTVIDLDLDLDPVIDLDTDDIDMEKIPLNLKR